jgi:hypothetical protein
VNRIRSSFELMKASWAVLRQERQLAWYPVISVACAIVLTAVFLIPVAVGVAASGTQDRYLPVWAYAPLAMMYVGLAFVQTFFNAALISAANEHFEGGHPTFASGIAAASRRIGTIAGWALIAATVGLVLRSLQERLGFVGRLIVGALGVGWNLLTFFVVPVLVFEGIGPIQAVKRSGHLFKARWGEAVVGSSSIAIAGALIILPAILVVALGVALASAVLVPGLLLVGLGLVLIVGVVIVTSAMQQIYNTALYRFAVDAPSSGAFSSELLRQTFRPKGAR